jgi:hypothetical protein
MLRGFWGDIADALGIRDPLSYYYPNETPSEIYAKVKADLLRYGPRIKLLGSATNAATLQQRYNEIMAETGRLDAAFAGGATPGERDLDRLRAFVKAYRSFRSDLWSAENEYGSRAPGSITPPDSPTVPSSQVVTTQQTPATTTIIQESQPASMMPMLLLGGGILAAFMLMNR